MSHLYESYNMTHLISFVYNHFIWRFFRSHRWFGNLFRRSRRRCRTSRWCCHRCVNWRHICGSIVIYTLTYSTFSSFLSISFLFCFPGDNLGLLPLKNIGSKWTVKLRESNWTAICIKVNGSNVSKTVWRRTKTLKRFSFRHLDRLRFDFRAVHFADRLDWVVLTLYQRFLHVR